MLIQQMARD